MKLLVDSREQKPLTFNHPMVTHTDRTKLDVGDYGCEFKDGYIPPLFFERKSIADLYGTMTSGYPRFKRAINRANDADVALILVVEGTLTKVAKGYEFSQWSGDSMIRKLFTLWIRYKLLTVFCRDRKEMAEYILQTYLAMGREYIRGKKQ